MYHQLAIVLATGNSAAIDVTSGLMDTLATVPPSVKKRIEWVSGPSDSGPLAGALVEGDAARTKALTATIAAIHGPLVPVQSATTEEIATHAAPYCISLLFNEVSTSTNTTAAGGNASLMSIG